MDKTTNEAWTGKKGELSIEAQGKRKKINKKILKFGCLPIFIFSFIILLIINNNSKKTEVRDETKKETKFINGIKPTDVYLNMEKQNFKTDKQFNREYGNNWISTKKIEGIDYKVETYSSSTNNVERVRGTAIINPNIKEIEATKGFLKYLGSLPYKNSNTNEATEWIEKNFNSDKKSKIIGDAKLTIYAPSKIVRMITIEKAKK